MRKKNPDVASFWLPICFFPPPQLLGVSLKSLKYAAFLKSLKSLFTVAFLSATSLAIWTKTKSAFAVGKLTRRGNKPGILDTCL